MTRPGTGPASLTLDAGALIAVERRSPVMRSLLRETAEGGWRVLIPAPVLAQVFRDGARQVLLSRLLNRPELVTVVPMDAMAAFQAGLLCGRAGTADVVDAAVVVCARLSPGCTTIVTSDPGDIAKLIGAGPPLRVIEI